MLPKVGTFELHERELKWAEELGFASGWLPDNFSRFGVGFEPWTVLAALARATTRVRLGTLVTSVVARHPTLLALQVLTNDRLSGGRVELGIGAGDAPEDCDVFGLPRWPPRERVARLEEQLSLLDLLLRGEHVDQRGEFYSAFGAQLPRPVQRPRPPLIVAGEGRRTLELVARFADGWVTLGGQPIPAEWAPWGGDRVTEEEALRRTRTRTERLDSYCVDYERHPESIRRSVLTWRTDFHPLSSLDAFDHFVGSYREVGMEEFVFIWPPEFPQQVTVDQRAKVEEIASARFGVGQST